MMKKNLGGSECVPLSETSTSQKSTCGIAVMAKASRPGLTKTRLVPPLSYEEAASFNTAFLKDVSRNILAAGIESSVAGYMAFGPPGSEAFFKNNLPAEIGLLDVWLPNFGDCLFKAICDLLDRGHASAVVLNSDSPTLPTSILIETARLLAEPGDRAVLGPSNDGGYYLLGLKQKHRRLFEDVAWSTETVADETRARAREIGLELCELPTWYDVDDAAALRMLHGEVTGLGAFDATLRSHDAPNTAALLSSLMQRPEFCERLGIRRTQPERTASVPA